MTLLELRTLALDWLDDPDGTYFTPAIMNKRLNLALYELQKDLILAGEYYYVKCVTTPTVAQQAMYALPSDFIAITRLSRNNPGETWPNIREHMIYPMSQNEQDLIRIQQGDPHNYFFQKNNIRLYPTPNRVVQLNLSYVYRVEEMVDDTDEPDAPLMYQEFIPILAARDGFLKDGRDIAPIQKKLDDYQTLLKSVSDERSRDYPRMVIATPDGFGDN